MKSKKMPPEYEHLRQQHAQLQEDYDALKQVMDDGLQETRVGQEVLTEREKRKPLAEELTKLMVISADSDWGPNPYVCRWCRCWLLWGDASPGFPEEDHAPDCLAALHLGRPASGKVKTLKSRGLPSTGEPDVFRRDPPPLEKTPVTPASMMAAALAQGEREPLQPPRRRRVQARPRQVFFDGDDDESW